MIYFVRHGQSEANASNTLAGSRVDSPLTAHGREQAKASAEKIKALGVTIDHIVSSPMSRTRDSAHIIAETLGLDSSDITYDQRLIEHDCGDLTGKPTTDYTSEQLVTSSGTESAEHLLSRAQSALRDIVKLPGTTLIVSHAGVGRMILAKHFGHDLKDYNDIEGIENGAVVPLDLTNVIE